MRRFANKNDLPTRIKDALPDDAQQTYMDAMNEASDMPDSEAHGRAMHAVAKKHPGAPFVANPFTGGYGARESTGGSPRYASTADLPQSVKDEIPESDLEAYLEAINQVPEGTPEDNAHEIAKTACANQGRSVTKESGSPGDYLVVEDPKESSKWHLQVRANGKPDHRLMGAAWAALHGGYRGNKYEGPDKEKAIERLKALYKSENMPLPAMESAQMEPPEKNSLDAVQLIEESAALSAPKTTEGLVWESEILRSGYSMNPCPETGLKRFYPPEFIAKAAPAFEGAPSFTSHFTTDVKDAVGVMKNTRAEMRVNPAIRAELHVFKSEESLRKKMLDAAAAGKPMGLSMRAMIGFKRVQRDGRQVMEATHMIPGLPCTVDLTMMPAAGGRTIRAIEGVEIESALESARKQFVRPAPQDAANQNGSATRSIGAHMKEQAQESTKLESPTVRVSEAFSEAAGAQNGNSSVTAEELKAVREELQGFKTELEKSQKAQRVAESGLLLKQKVEASKLPTPIAKLVTEQFTGKECTAEEIDAEIQRHRDAYAAVVPSGIRATGGAAAVVMESQEKMQVALDKLFGLRKGPDGKEYDASIPAFRGVQEAYILITGDRDIAWYPRAGSGVGAVREEWNAAGFANALGNTLYRRLIADYAEVDYGIDMLCPPREPHRVALKDFRTHDIVRVGYMQDLTLVDPEQVDWPELSAPTDEQATLTAVQFGGLITVTRKTIINDDLGLVAKVASRAGRAARRTMARRLFNLPINNAAIYDSIAFFHASHNNLGSTALAAAELNAIRTAMRNQTEKDSNEKLGLAPFILVVPNALEGTAKQENMRQWLDNNFTPNPVQYMFGEKNERIVVSPLLTDTNDYYAFADPDQVQTFEMGFLQGKQEPELLLADNQLVGKAFTGDRIQYKIRHEYEIAVVDFRGAYKEVVA